MSDPSSTHVPCRDAPGGREKEFVGAPHRTASWAADEEGRRLWEALREDRQQLDGALGVETAPRWGTVRDRPRILVEKRLEGDVLDPPREEALDWLADHVERWLRVFRPALQALQALQDR